MSRDTCYSFPAHNISLEITTRIVGRKWIGQEQRSWALNQNISLSHPYSMHPHFFDSQMHGWQRQGMPLPSLPYFLSSKFSRHCICLGQHWVRQDDRRVLLQAPSPFPSTLYWPATLRYCDKSLKLPSGPIWGQEGGGGQEIHRSPSLLPVDQLPTVPDQSFAVTGRVWFPMGVSVNESLWTLPLVAIKYLQSATVTDWSNGLPADHTLDFKEDPTFRWHLVESLLTFSSLWGKF